MQVPVDLVSWHQQRAAAAPPHGVSFMITGVAPRAVRRRSANDSPGHVDDNQTIGRDLGVDQRRYDGQHGARARGVTAAIDTRPNVRSEPHFGRAEARL
jgi:hypothetical protein